MRRLVKKLFKTLGYQIRPVIPPDVTAAERNSLRYVEAYTMTSPERLLASMHAAAYVTTNRIQGDIVECGVWRGGNCMAIARTLLEHQDITRTIYCYDTYEGMTEPTAHDVEVWQKPVSAGWAPASLDDVRANVSTVGYPMQNFVFVKGPVEETIPKTIPERISILRLDTDWYKSTKHELEHLYPRLVTGGILMIDDYGHHSGARQAVDEYFSGGNSGVFLNRIDYTGRLVVKY